MIIYYHHKPEMQMKKEIPHRDDTESLLKDITGSKS